MRMARKRRWNVFEEKRIKEEIELQVYLNGLILADKEAKLAKLREEVKVKGVLSPGGEANPGYEEQEAEQLRSMEQIISSTFDERLQSCNDLFMAVDDRRKVSLRFSRNRTRVKNFSILSRNGNSEKLNFESNVLI